MRRVPPRRLPPQRDLRRLDGARTEDGPLLAGPNKAPSPIDFTATDPWRVMRITGELVAGFDKLAHAGPAITVFGSARITEQDPYYQAARQIGRLLAERGFAVITGGGPGI